MKKVKKAYYKVKFNILVRKTHQKPTKASRVYHKGKWSLLQYLDNLTHRREMEKTRLGRAFCDSFEYYVTGGEEGKSFTKSFVQK